MMGAGAKDRRVNVRLSIDLYEAIARQAAENGFDISKEIRWELESIRGMVKMPSMPGHDHTTRTRKQPGKTKNE
jgi:hypothetical protein